MANVRNSIRSQSKGLFRSIRCHGLPVQPLLFVACFIFRKEGVMGLVDPTEVRGAWIRDVYGFKSRVLICADCLSEDELWSEVINDVETDDDIDGSPMIYLCDNPDCRKQL
jgi:hypothetical protein